MKKFKSFNLIGLFYRVKALLRSRKMKKFVSVKDYSKTISSYAGEKHFSSEEANKYIYSAIISGKPFFAGRFGAFELLNMRHFDFGGFIGQKFDENFHFNKLCNNAGFFPKEKSLLSKFVFEIKSACKAVDFLAVWYNQFEDYYIKHNMHNPKITYLLDFEPWSCPENPWSAALKGKKVLVIHPFVETINRQYARREEIFPGMDILPEFELKTLKAVQTIAGEKDERFKTWFDALDWMYEEALKIDFDVAIIGCGAYGFPLAAKLKDAGKQAIHLAGATQLLFGIKGKRWEENPAFEYVKKYFNDSWVYPSEEDKPKNSKSVEGGCYWK